MGKKGLGVKKRRVQPASYLLAWQRLPELVQTYTLFIFCTKPCEHGTFVITAFYFNRN